MSDVMSQERLDEIRRELDHFTGEWSKYEGDLPITDACIELLAEVDACREALSGRIVSTVRAAVEVEVLIDAAEALVEACGHGAGEPIDGRYTGVRVVELDAFASALAAVRRTKEA